MTKLNETWKKNVFIFLSGQAVSLFGSLLVQYAISWYIVLRTQSGVMMTISVICGFCLPCCSLLLQEYGRIVTIAKC